MMINAALRWTAARDKSLWTMAMDHAVQLHNHTTHISSVMSPEEFSTRYKSYHSAIQNAQPWR